MSATETVKLPTWHRQLVPLSDYERSWIRMVVTRAVYSVWNRFGRPTDLAEIYRFYLKQAAEGDVPTARSKRTVDRRVNEAASLEHGAKIVSVTAGIYQPNPELFTDRAREELK